MVMAVDFHMPYLFFIQLLRRLLPMMIFQWKGKEYGCIRPHVTRPLWQASLIIHVNNSHRRTGASGNTSRGVTKRSYAIFTFISTVHCAYCCVFGARGEDSYRRTSIWLFYLPNWHCVLVLHILSVSQIVNCVIAEQNIAGDGELWNFGCNFFQRTEKGKGRRKRKWTFPLSLPPCLLFLKLFFRSGDWTRKKPRETYFLPSSLSNERLTI